MAAVEAESIGLPFAQSVIRVTRTETSTKPGAEPKTGTRTYVSSLPCPSDQEQKAATPRTKRAARDFARVSRSHWSIENKNHWKKDAQWGDDTPRTKSPQVARALTMLKGGLLAMINEPMPVLFKKCAKLPSLAFSIVKSPLKPLN